MSKSWRELFMRIGKRMSHPLSYWHMSNGAAFHMSIPTIDQIKDESFTDEVGFPFVFSEIEKIEFSKTVGHGPHQLKTDLDTIRSLFPIEGLKIPSGDATISVVADK